MSRYQLTASSEPPEPDMPRQVPCPTCGQPSPWSSENASRPFCSERCKTIDLGAWSSESYCLPETAEAELPGDEGEMPGDF